MDKFHPKLNCQPGLTECPQNPSYSSMKEGLAMDTESYGSGHETEDPFGKTQLQINYTASVPNSFCITLSFPKTTKPKFEVWKNWCFTGFRFLGSVSFVSSRTSRKENDNRFHQQSTKQIIKKESTVSRAALHTFSSQHGWVPNLSKGWSVNASTQLVRFIRKRKIRSPRDRKREERWVSKD